MSYFFLYTSTFVLEQCSVRTWVGLYPSHLDLYPSRVLISGEPERGKGRGAYNQPLTARQLALAY